MKTPQQVADEEITSRFGIRPALMDPTVAITTATLREMIESAVQMDRHERDTLEVTLPSRQEVTVWIGTSGADGSAIVQVDTAGAEGNLRIFVNDSDEPAFDENPETGEYEVAPSYREASEQ